MADQNNQKDILSKMLGIVNSFLSDSIERLSNDNKKEAVDSLTTLSGQLSTLEQSSDEAVDISGLDIKKIADIYEKSVGIYNNNVPESDAVSALPQISEGLAAGSFSSLNNGPIDDQSGSFELHNSTKPKSPAAPIHEDNDSDEVSRLYKTILGRQPDAAGKAYWNGILKTKGIESVAAGILGTEEAKNRINQNGSLINAAYRGALGRDPDTEGSKYWAGIDPVKAAVGISRSNEASLSTGASSGGSNLDSSMPSDIGPVISGPNEKSIDNSDTVTEKPNAITRPGGIAIEYAPNGANQPDGSITGIAPSIDGPDTEQAKNDQVRRLFSAITGREADSEGLKYWAGVLSDSSAENVASNMLNTQEAKERIDSYDGNVVKAAYAGILGRDPDEAGLSYWSGMDKVKAIVALSNSEEAIAKTGTLPPNGFAISPGTDTSSQSLASSTLKSRAESDYSGELTTGNSPLSPAPSLQEGIQEIIDQNIDDINASSAEFADTNNVAAIDTSGRNAAAQDNLSNAHAAIEDMKSWYQENGNYNPDSELWNKLSYAKSPAEVKDITIDFHQEQDQHIPGSYSSTSSLYDTIDEHVNPISKRQPKGLGKPPEGSGPVAAYPFEMYQNTDEGPSTPTPASSSIKYNDSSVLVDNASSIDANNSKKAAEAAITEMKEWYQGNSDVSYNPSSSLWDKLDSAVSPEQVKQITTDYFKAQGPGSYSPDSELFNIIDNNIGTSSGSGNSPIVRGRKIYDSDSIISTESTGPGSVQQTEEPTKESMPTMTMKPYEDKGGGGTLTGPGSLTQAEIDYIEWMNSMSPAEQEKAVAWVESQNNATSSAASGSISGSASMDIINQQIKASTPPSPTAAYTGPGSLTGPGSAAMPAPVVTPRTGGSGGSSTYM